MAAELIDWSEKLSVGEVDIDLQHRYFVNLINRLTADLRDPHGDKVYQERLVDELNCFAQLHFKSEENIMFKARYPGFVEHKLKHERLLDKLNGQVGLYCAKLIGAERIARYLKTWLVRHILVEDKKFQDFLVSRGGSEAQRQLA